MAQAEHVDQFAQLGVRAVRVVVVGDERGVSGDRLVLRARQIGEHLAVDGEMLEDHAVLGERARLVREQVLDLA